MATAIAVLEQMRMLGALDRHLRALVAYDHEIIVRKTYAVAKLRAYGGVHHIIKVILELLDIESRRHKQHELMVGVILGLDFREPGFEPLLAQIVADLVKTSVPFKFIFFHRSSVGAG